MIGRFKEISDSSSRTGVLFVEEKNETDERAVSRSIDGNGTPDKNRHRLNRPSLTVSVVVPLRSMGKRMHEARVSHGAIEGLILVFALHIKETLETIGDSKCARSNSKG